MHPPPYAPQRNRALFLHLQQFVIATVYPFLVSLYIHTFKPIDEQDEEYLAPAKDKWSTLLAPTLVTFLGTNNYFVGNKLSAIDFWMCKPSGRGSGGKNVIFSNGPNSTFECDVSQFFVRYEYLLWARPAKARR